MASIGNILLGDNLYRKIYCSKENLNYKDSICDVIGLHATKLEIYDKHIHNYTNNSNYNNNIPFILEIKDLWWRL